MLYVMKEVSVNQSRNAGEPELSRAQVWERLEEESQQCTGVCRGDVEMRGRRTQ
jgi:hypothetical protein